MVGRAVNSERGKRNGSSKLLILCLTLILVACASVGFLQAQVLYGTLMGNVTDPSGAALAGARVEARNVNTGVVRTETTDDTGIYRFTALLPGTYRVSISADKFGTFVTENVAVDVNGVRRLDAQLKVATQAQEVVVEAEAAALQTDKADVHTDLSAKQIENLPITSSQGRNFQALYRIIPGFGLPVEANSSAANTQRSMSANVNGQSVQGNNTRIDGAQNSYPWLPANIAYVPPADAIETVNVVTNSFDAEQGNAGGAAVNVQIKSGTNQFHGTAHEFHTDHLFKNKDYFFPKTITRGGVTMENQKPKNIQNQFGGTFGGPIKKDKLFFFGDYERTTQRQLATKTMTVPTDAMRSGDFSAFATKIYDPNTGTADGQNRQQVSCNGVLNVICPQRIDPAAQKMLALIPHANLPGQSNNYFAADSAAFTRNNVDSKINYVPNDKAMVFARYSASWSYIFDPPVFGEAGGDAMNNGQLGNAYSRIQNIGLGATYTFNPRLLLDWNFGFTRQRINAEALDIDSNFGLDTLGIPGTNGTSRMQGGVPFFSFATYSNLGNSNTGNPFKFRDQQFVNNANLSWMKGKHSIRFGLEMNRAQINHFQPQGGSFQTARGSFKFNGNPTVLAVVGSDGKLKPAVAADQYNSMASFLFGLPSEVGKATQLVDPIAIRWGQWGWYARDQFQVTPKLTVNYGLRWEFYPMAHSDNGRGIRYLDPTTMNVIIGGVNGVPIDDGVDVGKGQFLPRLGIAYRVTEKTVVRLGYGMSSDPNNFRFVRNWYPSVDNSDYTNTLTFGPAGSLTGTQTFAPYAGLMVGIPAAALPDISKSSLPLPSNRTTGTLANPFRRGYTNSFNFMIQREFAGFTGEAGYVGTRGIRPLTNLNFNAAPIGGTDAGRALNVKFNGNWRDINIEMPFKNSYYDSLQTKLTRRMGASQIGVAYTFSKAINYSDNEELNYLLFPYPDYWEKAKGLASFDRTHNFQFYGLYQLPFGKGKRFASDGWASKIAGGWQLNWVFSHLSGTPFTITADGSSLAAPGNTQTADLVGRVVIIGGDPAGSGGSCAASNMSCHYFNPSAFAQPTGARFGTSGRDIVRGPGFTNLDTSVFRNFKLNEKFTFQFRAEAFGVTNTPHFSNPNAAINGSNFGIITGTLGGNSGTNLNGARTFWFAGKLMF